MLTEIYLWHACARQELLRTETAGQGCKADNTQCIEPNGCHESTPEKCADGTCYRFCPPRFPGGGISGDAYQQWGFR
jgi:hypothetical protein